MSTKFRLLQRIAYTMAALAVFGGVLYPVFKPTLVAAAQLTTRSITMSDSGQSGGTITTGVGSGTNVIYKFAFTTSSAAQSMVIDFCSTSPLIGDTCTAPVGMNASAAVLTGITGNITTAGWTVTATASQIKLAKGATGTAATSGIQSFTLSGLTNPASVLLGATAKPVGTFYGRMYTYADSTFGSTSTAYVSPVSLGNYMDYGGIALSTNQIITITAKVQEQLTFCVSGAAQATWTTTNDCSDTQAAVTPALTLGHGAPTAILDNSAVDTGTVYSQLSTNALYGAAVAIRNSTTCGGLSSDGGATCNIPAVNAGANTPIAITAGVAAFGLYVTNGVIGTGGVGADLADTNYNDGTPTHYGMDTETVADIGAVNGTYGDRVAYSSAPCYRINNNYTFAATSSLTTPAGIYTANMDLIATGTF